MHAIKVVTSLRTAAAILFVSLAPLAVADDNCEKLGIFDVYRHLLPPGDLRAGEVESITLRYIPGDTSNERELELRIATTLTDDTTMEVLEPKGLSIQTQFTALRANLAEGCEETLLKQIEIERRDVSSAIALGIRQKLLRKRVDVELKGDLYLDSPRYELWIKAPMNETSWVLYGPDSRKELHPLIDWAKAAIRAVQRSGPVQHAKD